jgi:cell division protein FtsN
MAKDYAKATFNKTRVRKQLRLRRILFFFILFILGSICTSGVWYISQQGFNKENAMTWVNELKTLLHRQKLSVATNQNTKMERSNSVNQDPPIRFDFYTELPEMQVTLPQKEEERSANLEARAGETFQKKPESAALPADNSAQNASDKTITSGLQNQSAPIMKSFNNNVEAETRDVNSHPVRFLSAGSSEVPVKSIDRSQEEIHYVVQVGAYKSNSTASEMRISILLAGFDVKVVKTTIDDRVIYRIQQGPFGSLARAKIAQKKLQAKGFDGVVQKIN